MNKPQLPHADVELISKQIESFILDKTVSFGYSGAVIGLSGGIDSAVTSTLALSAYDNYGRDFKVKCVSMPSKENLSESSSIARTVAKFINTKFSSSCVFEEINIDPHVETFEESFNDEFSLTDFDKGNMTARVRANILSTISARDNFIVLGTGNLDEGRIGYYTMFGDGAVHCHPIGNVPKRFVRKIGEYFNLPDYVVERTPRDGLEEDRDDFDDLGYNYKIVEYVCESLDQGFNPCDDHYGLIRSFLLKRKSDQFYSNGELIGIDYKIEEIVSDIKSRIKTANSKEDIISPPKANIALEY